MAYDASNHPGAQFIKALFGPSTQNNVFLTSLANEQTDDDKGSAPRQLVTRDIYDITQFANRWDQPGRGLFFCVGTIQTGQSRRAKNNIAEHIGLHADIDLKSVADDIPIDGIIDKLNGQRLVPSAIVKSGGGIHVYYLFHEGIDASPETINRIEAALRLLADTVGGDPAVCEISRLLRLPGTHNTKDGAWTEVEVVERRDSVRYELDELEEWLSETSPIIRRKDRLGTTSASDAATNPFLAVAERFGFKPPIDIETRLAAMSYQGSGETAIHQTQLQVSASLLSRGVSTDDATSILLDATQAAAGPHGANWNWGREEKSIRSMCEDWIKKNPTVLSLPAAQIAIHAATSASPHTPQATTATVTDLSEVRTKKESARKERIKAATEKATEAFIIVAEGVLEGLRQNGRDIILTEGKAWIYGDGLWHILTPADEQWIRSRIQDGFRVLDVAPKSQNLSNSWNYLTQHPDLHKHEVAWAPPNYIVAKNGVLDTQSGEFCAHAPEFFARRQLAVEYVPGAACPLFLTYLQDMFEPLGKETAQAFINVIQEFLGTCLAPRTLSREQRKAVLLYGPSRTGKTELATIVRLLLGSGVANPSVAEISDRWGLQSFYGATAWIRDDAINEGDQIDPQRFKVVVTGEVVNIDIKHQAPVTGFKCEFPVLLTSNSLPRARDQSAAVFNRCMVLDCPREFTEAESVAYRNNLGIPPGKSPGEHIFESEGPGIFNWALDGLHRLSERGMYDLPDRIKESIQRFRDDNNPVGEWARTALVKAPGSKVSRGDLLCAFHGWQKESDGDDARAFGGRAFFPRLRAVVPSCNPDVHDNGRYVGGVKLTNEGLNFWQAHSTGPQLRGGSKGTSVTKQDVNKVWSSADAVSVARTADNNKPLNHKSHKPPRF